MADGSAAVDTAETASNKEGSDADKKVKTIADRFVGANADK